MSWLHKRLSLLFLFLIAQDASAQTWLEPSDTLDTERQEIIITWQTGLYAGSQIGLYAAWYSQFDHQGFHFFNDWNGWNQMDKIGHATAAYQISTNLYGMNRWAGVSEQSSLRAAAILGVAFLSTVEVMDGFSEGWGFSLSDVAFNTVGSALFWSQQKVWKAQRIKLKFSYSTSDVLKDQGFEGKRAKAIFGEHIFEQWLKDYNGQTYWVSANIWSLVGKPSSFPKWVNVAAGYSANNLLGAESNSWEEELPGPGTRTITSNLVREREFILSLDIDLYHTNLPTYLNWIKPIFGIIKLPFPAVGFGTASGIRFHPLYF